MPNIDVPQSIWELAQKKSGMKNPRNYLINNVLLKWVISVSENTTPVDSTQPPVQLDKPARSVQAAPRGLKVDLNLQQRKAALGVLDHPLDKYFQAAWRWMCGELGGELALVEYLEEQVSLPEGRRMHTPRMVILRRFQQARKAAIKAAREKNCEPVDVLTVF